eukprot:TRINITY_DN3505_c0_g2_i5.p1 TRINITY_DN3505_c0_g2~~TRINITY_DN3505_c0_g2_i5.p1  ORF type:complete len:487 (-),score=64.66 TRINITY_DN3505_c0_g2_i5:99-1559(-)
MGYAVTQFVPNAFLPVYTCLICNGIAVTPLVLKCCDALVCEDCFKQMEKCTKGCTTNFKAKPLSGPSKRVYDLLAINCSHSPSCSWCNSLSTLDAHLNSECNFHPLPCSNRGCDGMVVRTKMDDHRKECSYRLCECMYCEENIVFLEMGDHYNVCPSFPVSCPHNREFFCPIMPRSALNKHFEVCPSVVVSCAWLAFGCDFVGKRSEMCSHMQTSSVPHLKAVKRKLVDLNPIEKEQIDLVQNEENNDNEKIEDKDEENSEPLLVLSLKRESEKLGNAFQVLQSQLTNKRIKLENFKSEYKKFKDQFTEMGNETNGLKKRCIDLGKENATLKAKIEKCEQANKQLIEIKNESNVLKKKIEKYEKEFTRLVVIENFKNRTAHFETANFTISGLEWSLLIYPQGIDFDNHLSVFLTVPVEKQSPFGWKRKVKFTIKLMNPLEDGFSVTLTASHTFYSEEVNSGWPQFIPLNDLLAKGFTIGKKKTFEV